MSNDKRLCLETFSSRGFEPQRSNYVSSYDATIIFERNVTSCQKSRKTNILKRFMLQLEIFVKHILTGKFALCILNSVLLLNM